MGYIGVITHLLTIIISIIVPKSGEGYFPSTVGVQVSCDALLRYRIEFCYQLGDQ